MHVTNIKGTWSDQLLVCKKYQTKPTQPHTLNIVRANGVLARKHFSALDCAGDTVMLPAGTVSLAKVFKGWDSPQAGVR